MNNPINDSPKTSPSKILVLGATGGTGRRIVGRAQARGHEVTALVRSPDKARHLEGARLVIGDARDEAVLRAALKDQDAVISALGTPASPFGEVTLLSTATRALVKAMKAERVSRLVLITGIGAGDSAGHGGFLFDKAIFPLLLKNVYADKNRQEAIVRDSGLDWVLVRSLRPEQQARQWFGSRSDGSLRLPWRNRIARRRRELRPRPAANQHLVASRAFDHVVTAAALPRIVVPVRRRGMLGCCRLRVRRGRSARYPCLWNTGSPAFG
ncbi:putative NADH-flavin reductase [Bradyrhizobium sp. USDA 4461]